MDGGYYGRVEDGKWLSYLSGGCPQKYAMKSAGNIDKGRIHRVASAYNMIPNLLWTIMFLLPAFMYVYGHMTPRTAWIMVGGSLPILFLPNRYVDMIQWSRKSSGYEKLGVKYINALAQDGALLNWVLRRRYPAYKVVKLDRSALWKKYRQTYMFERFHWSLFLLFSVLTVHACVRLEWGWVIFLCIGNLFYNVYPNLLQQYIRVKLATILSERVS
jgi:Glycosyl-4,4'-diaponeurosporenoate acyltransferase